jgi:threonine/homoserine/homoserine lactone efflux protein
VSDTPALFLRCFLIGVAVAAPVGAMGVLCIQRTLARGWRAGMATGLGIATADAAYASIAAFGVSAVSSLLVSAQNPLRIVGGAALVYLGARAAILASRGQAATRIDGGSRPTPAGSRATGLYVSAVGLTLTNPMTIMAFAAVFAGAGLSVAPGLGPALTATVGVFLGSLFWWVCLVSAVAAMHHAIGRGVEKAVGVISGLAIAAFGLIALLGTLP